MDRQLFRRFTSSVSLSAERDTDEEGKPSKQLSVHAVRFKDIEISETPSLKNRVPATGCLKAEPSMGRNWQVLLCVLVTLEVTVCQKTSDESRPYEFGFTIDGQQHRHEKKDQNGIIQGEFGFITADGVYHVTVYATDENGDFKILSMRNIRISAPLDGSPALGPISPEASKYLKKANLPNQIEPAKSKPLPVTPQKFERIQEAPPKSSTQKPIVSTQKAPYVFTTHSTIRPACAGCGLITTRKPGEKFVFQNPAFRDSPPSSTKTVIQSPLGPPALQSGAITDLQNRFGDLPSDTELLPPNFNGKIVQSTAGKPPVTFAKVQNFESPKQKFNPGFKSPVDGNEIQLNKANQGSGVPSPSNVPFVSQGPVKPLNDVPVLDSFGPPGGAVPPNGVQAPNAVQTLSRDQAPTGVQAPNGVQAPSGVQTLSGVQTPSGVQIPSGVQVPSSAQTSGGIETFGYDRTSEQVDQNLNGVVDSVNAADQDEKVELVSGQVNQGNLQQDKLGRLVAPSIGTNGPNPLLQPQDVSKLPPVMISDNVIHVMGKKPLDIAIKDKYPGMVDGLPEGVEVKDVTGILYKFKYTVGFHGHYEKGLKNGTKIGGYFVNGRDGISRIVTYVADENGYRPKFKFVNLGLDSSDTPNEKTEKTFGLKDFEFVWYPVE